jgi:hypothetical protein
LGLQRGVKITSDRQPTSNSVIRNQLCSKSYYISVSQGMAGRTRDMAILVPAFDFCAVQPPNSSGPLFHTP